MKKLIRQHPLITYILFTYLLSWSIFIPLALKKHQIIDIPIPFSIYYGAAYGPMLAAIITTAITGGCEALKELFGRMFRWRVSVLWWMVALSPLLFFGFTVVILRFVKGGWFDPNLLGQVEFLPDLGVGALGLWLLTYGIGEETGWRGFALPRLQKNRSALRATLWLWIFWALWHTPAFFLVYDPKILPGLLPGLLAGAILLTWLYNSSHGSIPIVAIWHGVFNFTTASKASKAGLISAVITTIVMAWAVVVILVFRARTLSHAEKQVI